MSSRIRLVLLLLVACLAVGCATQPPAVEPNVNVAPGGPMTGGEKIVRGLYRAACFLPDRLLDVTDMFSFILGVGYGFDLHRHLTYYCHVPSIGWYRSWDISWRHGRRLGFVHNQEQEAGFLNMYFHDATFVGWGLGWKDGERVTVMKTLESAPTDAEVYKKKIRDKWAVGLTYGPFGAGPRFGFNIHPLEIADLFVGLATLGFVDIGHDDLASRR